MDRVAVEAILERWARFYYEFDFGVGFPHESVSSPKIRSTRPSNGFYIPDDIENIDWAIRILPLRQMQVVKAEYLQKGGKRRKAKHLDMSYSCYRATLSTALNKLQEILDML